MADDLNVRVALLENDKKHMTEKLDKVAEQVAELHSLMFQAKGARWAILLVVGISSFVAGVASWWLNIFGAGKLH
jgi:wobble nucleotide-excising tRNase